MSDHIYKKIELTGTSEKSMEEAINNTVRKASKTIHDMRWFEVIETRGTIMNGQVKQWQVTVRVGFAVDDT